MRIKIFSWLTGFVAAFFCLSWTPLPNALLWQLENLHSAPKGSLEGYAGVLVLGGGAYSKHIGQFSPQIQLLQASDRMVQAVVLLKKYPKFWLVYTSEDYSLKMRPELASSGVSQAEKFFLQMQVSHHRLIMENSATNTRENAIFTAALPNVNVKTPWLLLTSAAHMPRALAAFRKVGWNVNAYPVDYRARKYISWFEISLVKGAALWQNLAYEIFGWAKYWVRNWV